jgi:hypothetical protein
MLACSFLIIFLNAKTFRWEILLSRNSIVGWGQIMNKELDDDDVFYGSGKAKKKENDKSPDNKSSDYKSDYRDPQPGGQPVPASEQPASEPVRDIEKEITDTRHEKQMAAELLDVTKLRQQAAKHSADAAKLYKRYRSEEAAMVKFTENASKARRTAEGYEQKSKEATAKADEKQKDLEFLQDRKAEKARIKVAKLHAKSAKMKAKASGYMAKAAKLSQKAAAKREKSKALLEKSKMHEAEAHNLNKRADRLSKA